LGELEKRAKTDFQRERVRAVSGVLSGALDTIHGLGGTEQIFSGMVEAFEDAAEEGGEQ
jgi:hypothetical protein